MKLSAWIYLVPVLGVVVAGSGCGSAPSAEAVPTQTVSVDGTEFLLSEEPDGAVGVIEAREAGEDGQPIVVVGRIGGAENPWVAGRAAFTMIDASKEVVAEGADGDDAELCLGDCCAEERAACTTLVKVVDADGKLVPADARQLLGVAASDLVVVSGKVNKDKSGNFVVLARGIHVRR